MRGLGQASLVRHWAPQGGARYASKMERTDKTNPMVCRVCRPFRPTSTPPHPYPPLHRKGLLQYKGILRPREILRLITEAKKIQPDQKSKSRLRACTR